MAVGNPLFDKADWYFEDALTNYIYSYNLENEELTQDNYREIHRWVANHIGFFVTWLIQNDAKEMMIPDEETSLQSVKDE